MSSGPWLLTSALLALALGCTGAIEAPAAGPVEAPGTRPRRLACDAISPGRSPLQRLTRVQYDRAIEDLFGDATRPATRLVDGERGEVNADARIVSTTLANQYLLAAEDVSERATADLEAFLGCEASAACMDAWLTRRGRLVFRRPLSDAEHEALGALYRTVEDELGAQQGTRAVLEAMLQSPAFLYRVEIPEEEALAGDADIVRLGAYALATRLAFALWQSTPDAELLDRAEAGDLDDDDGVAAVAREMLTDPRAEAGMLAFFEHYLDLGQLDGLTKDPATFPDFDATIPPLLRQETEQFLLAVFRSEDASWEELLTADWTMMNGALSAYYGLGDVRGPDFERVALDGRYHSGLLTQGSIAASRGRATGTDPVHRGMFVRGKLLCGDVPDVPEGLQLDAPDPDPTLTYREQLEEHRSDPVCASCHVLMDPLGFALEHFDGDGRFRADDRGLPIDATGEIVASDVNGFFDGAPELAARLAESDQARACFGEAYLAFQAGRAFDPARDGCSLQALMDRFVAGELSLRELMVGMTQTDAFLYRVADQDTLPAPPLGGTGMEDDDG